MPPPQGTFNPIEGPGDYTVTKVIHNTSYPAISPLSIPPLNKSIFIVGASRGIGFGMAISFAQAGASKIAIAARSDLTSVKTAILEAASKANRVEPQVTCINLDVSSKKSTEAAAKRIEAEFGILDILLLNAGSIGSPKLIIESDPEEWWNPWEVNVKGAYMITRAFLPLILKGGDKTIIATSSVGVELVVPRMSAYQDSKLAVLRFLQFVDAEYSEKGVVAFGIHPGNVVTEMVEGLGGLADWMIPVFVETPDLAGDTLVFLTKEKRDWLSGRYVNVTWDMPELMAQKDEIVKGDKLKVRMVI